MEKRGGLFPPETDRPRAILPAFRGALESFALEQFDQRGGQERRDHRQTVSRLERIHAGADEGKRLFSPREMRPDIKGFERGGVHGGWRSVDEFHLGPNFLHVGIGRTRAAEIGIFYERGDPLPKLAAQLEVGLVPEVNAANVGVELMVETEE